MLFNPFDLRPIYNVCEKPPTLYSLLESIVNYGTDEKTKIKDLAKEGRTTIFDFDYPLTSNINKEDFECMILNHFIMRRIGFQTPTAFKIQLNVKLNSIMPMYNKMFDMIEGWNIFNNGEVIERTLTDDKTIENTTDAISSSTSASTNQSAQTTSNTNQSAQTTSDNETNTIEGSTSSQNSMSTETTTSVESTNDKRHSDTPQNAIQDVQNGTYVSDYTLTAEEKSAEDNTESTGSTSSTSESEETKAKTGTTNLTENTSGTNNITENKNINSSSNSNVENNGSEARTLTETITRTPADKMKLYKEFTENKQSIYSMIFKDLDCLFLQIY